MKTGILFKKWTAALVAVLMMISLFALPVFADEATTAATQAATTAATTEPTTGSDTTTTGTEETEEDTGLSTGTIVGLIIGGVLLVVAVVLCIVFREKVGKFFRVYRSEVKKIVWLPWSQTKKSTLVVLVVLIICAVAICLIDLGLSKGFLAFIKLFNPAK